MTSYVTPKKNAAFILYVGLPSYATLGRLKSGATIAAGDFQVSKDGGAFANLTNLPVATGVGVQLSLTNTEMNADNVTIACVDQTSPPEWCDTIVNVQTSARQVDDLAYPATSGRSMVVDAAGLVDANAVKLGPTGAGTAQTAGDVGAKTAGLTFTVAGMVDSNVIDWKGAAAPAMTGDAFARLGAPAGASVSADIAAVKVDTANIYGKVDTEVAAIITTLGVAGAGLTALGDVRIANLDATVSSRLASAGYTAPDNASITAIKAKTDNLPSDPADESLIIAATDALATLINAVPTANGNADALLDRADAIETGWTLRKVLRIMSAAINGKVSGGGTATNTFRNITDSKDRVTSTVDANGNRTAVTNDGA